MLVKTINELTTRFKGYEYFCILGELNNKVLYMPNHKIVFISIDWLEVRYNETPNQDLKEFRNLLVNHLKDSLIETNQKNLIQEVINRLKNEIGECL